MTKQEARNKPQQHSIWFCMQQFLYLALEKVGPESVFFALLVFLLLLCSQIHPTFAPIAPPPPFSIGVNIRFIVYFHTSMKLSSDFPTMLWNSCFICCMSTSQRVTIILINVLSFVPRPWVKSKMLSFGVVYIMACII